MRASYYVIELSRRWLTVLLVALALVMVLAFALGYGAAWSVLSHKRTAPSISALTAAALPTPTEIPEEVIAFPPPTATAVPSATQPPAPTATPRQPTPTHTPTPTPAPDGFHVQVLASSSSASIAEARSKLEGLGFPRSNQQLISAQESGSGVLYKLRVGPFPDRASADRVAQRMQAAGFSDAWVVAP